MYIYSMISTEYTSTVEYRLRDVPEGLWKSVKHLAIDLDKTINDTVIYLIEKAIAKENGKQ